MSSGFTNGVLQTNLTGLVYANGINAVATSLPYNENIFTPTLQGSTTAGTTTYTSQSGNFIKIGDLVFFNLKVSFSQMTGTGDLQITNLPYACNIGTYAIATTQNIDWPNNQGTYLQAYVLPTTTTAVIQCFHDTNAEANMQCPTGTGSYTVNLSGVYQST